MASPSPAEADETPCKECGSEETERQLSVFGVGSATPDPPALISCTSGRPVALNFIFTTCTTICPVLSATFSQAQEDLQEQSTPPIMISVSIDPDHDTPERLADYAKSFHAGPGWLFLTGSKGSLLEIQKSFDAYRGDKLNHVPLTFLRASPNSSWVRLEGFTSARELNEEYEELISDPQG